jgi:predicted glycoside hydrolase/deacetylase ChbG (UPF0249 family)
MASRDGAPGLQVVINADDFGKSDETVDATIECFEAGALTSATLMASMPATGRAAAFAASRPEFGFGAHLSFVRDPADRPLSDPARVPCLVDSDGRLLPTNTVRRRALLGRLDPAQIEIEIEAQVGALRDLGVPITHVDSHRHLHKFAPFRAALAEALPRLGITRVRAVQDVYLERAALSLTHWVGPHWRKGIRRSFDTTEHFFMPSMAEPPWSAQLLERVPTLAATSLEVGVHPGSDEAWRRRDHDETIAFAQGLQGIAALVDWRSVAPVGR